MDVAPPWVWAALGAVAGLAIIQSARLWWRDFWVRVQLRARMRRAAAGERDAERLLERAGYRVRERQVRAELAYALDGEPRVVEVRADFLLERDGRSWIAEVKTGAEAPRITTRATRRQLLEYAHAFDVAGVLLVDPERGRVHRVSLPAARVRRSARPLRELVILAVGVAAGAILASVLRGA